MSPVQIVVIDDNEIFRTTLCDFLAHLPDVTVVAAGHDGREALRLVETLKPDILILDLQMPEVDGLEVLQRLQSLATPVRVLVLSAHSALDYRQQALDVGADAYVEKGDVKRFAATLRQLISTLS